MTEATRRQLLDAGRRHFARQGLEGARVDRIAAEAQVNKALINYHFRGKQGLYEAVVAEALQEAELELSAALDSLEDPGHRLQAWPRILSELLEEREDLAPLLLGELLRRPDGALPGSALLAETLRAGRETGSLRQAESAPLLRILLGGVLLGRLAADEDEETATLLADLIAGGLVK